MYIIYLPEILKTGLADLLKSMLGKGMQFSKPSLDKRSGCCYVKMNLLQLVVKAWKCLPGIEKIKYKFFEILTEVREGGTGQPAPSGLPHICFEVGFRHGKYWQNIQAQG